MITLDCEQGTEDWFAGRRGIPTASNFSKIITGTGKASTSADTYMNELLAEWLADKSYSIEQSEWMARGNELEAEARAWYAMNADLEVSEVGLCYLDDKRLIGASPDGLCGDEGQLEIKCPKHSTHIGYLLKGKLPSAYKQQVQGQLWITGRQWCDFISYHPDFDPMLIRIERDEAFITELSAQVSKFVTKMLGLRSTLKQNQEAA